MYCDFVKPSYWRNASGKMKDMRSITGAGVLAAAGLALKTLTINVGQLFRVGFAFLATALSGYLYGPVVAGFAGAVLDVLGYFINPSGPYFFGFTLSAFSNGFIFGIILWNHKVSLLRTFSACLVSILVVSFLLNPIWLSMMYGEAWIALVIMRIPSNAMLLPINTGLLFMLLKLAEKQKGRLVKN